MSRRINARILGVIVGLVIAIGIVVIAIIIVNNNNNNTSTPTIEAQLTEDEQLRQEQDMMLGTKLDLANKEAKVLLEGEAFDINKVDQAYGDIIFYASAIERDDYLPIILDDEAELFLSKGLKQDALNVLKRVDIEKMDSFTQSEICNKVIGLARELGDNETVTRYSDILERNSGKGK